MPAQILATLTGCTMKSSPEQPELVGVVLRRVDKGLADTVAVGCDRGLIGMLLDHCEEVSSRPCSSR